MASKIAVAKKENGKIVKRYDSITEASRDTGVTETYIRNELYGISGGKYGRFVELPKKKNVMPKIKKITSMCWECGRVIEFTNRKENRRYCDTCLRQVRRKRDKFREDAIAKYGMPS